MPLPYPYSVKRHGVTIDNCDAEPVQTPGCIQAHGALLVLRPLDLTICQASDNTEAVLGKPHAELLGQPIAAVVGASGQERLQAFLTAEQTHQNPLYFVSLPARGVGPPLDVSVHTIDDCVVMEFEPTERGRAVLPDYYAVIKKTITRLQRVGKISELCQLLAEEVRALTGHDRVMVYKFHEDQHGEVVAESRRDGLSSWLGLHYPAEDIPKPAREIFQQVWLRPLADATAPLAELVPLVHPDTGLPLTMTYCALRGASVMYTEYLGNMGVRATFTLALRNGNGLWGLIACHHYDEPHHVNYHMRAACELVAQTGSLQLQATQGREDLLYRLRIESVHNDLVAQAAQEGGLSSITDGKPALLDGLNASGAALYHRDRWFTSGETPSEFQLGALAAWLNDRPEFNSLTRPIYATDRLSSAYPPAAAFAELGSGLLAFPLSRARRVLLMWFRPAVQQTVRWAGHPDDKPMVPGPHGPRLTPRRSFELFIQSVRDRALPWSSVEVEASARLRMLLVDLVVGRAEQLADLNANLARSNEELDSFAYIASHDLKEPLRAIHKYAYQLQEAAAVLTHEQRQRLDGLMRLTLRMDSLLDSLLHFSRLGRERLERDLTNLDELVSEAVEMVGARTGDVPTHLTVMRPMPVVSCDRVRCREIFVNLLSNALKYNDQSPRRIEIGYIDPTLHAAPSTAPEAAVGAHIYYVRDNGIGIDARHFAQIFRLFKRLHGRDDYGGGTGAGLSIVKKLVERHQGEIWLESEPGVGSTFYFTLSPRAGS
jgi:light-regulated signal transduction histidine kinase (bacteriophytochrome)